MGHSDLDPAVHARRPWNAGQNVGPKRPLKPRDIWAIRFYLDEHKRLRDRALFDLAIDSKLRGCDLVKLKIGDLVSGGQIRNRATARPPARNGRCGTGLGPNELVRLRPVDYSSFHRRY
jgi:integrase